MSDAAEALVVGGGLAGPALAIALARRGRSVLLLEKTRAAHPKVCGEFLSHEAVHYLGRLGLDPLALGAVPIERVRLAGRKVVSETRLPFRALSLSRERLDEALLEQACMAGVSVLRGRRVQALTPARGGWEASTEAGERFSGASAFLAAGKHDLYGWNRPAGKQNDLIAFKMHWCLAPVQRTELERHVDLIVFPGGYAGLQPVEDGAANLCLLVQREVFRAMGGSWPELLTHLEAHSPHLARRLDGATSMWARPLSLSAIPYGYVRREATDGVWRLGDQSAVIPSFSGDGMSIALHSGLLAAEVYAGGGDASRFQRRLHAEVAAQVRRATWLSRMLVRSPGTALAAARMLPSAMSAVAGRTRIRSAHLLP